MALRNLFSLASCFFDDEEEKGPATMSSSVAEDHAGQGDGNDVDDGATSVFPSHLMQL